MRRIVGLLVLLAACKEPPPPPPPPPVKLTDAEKAEIHRVIDAGRARVKEAEKARDAAFEHPGKISAKPCPLGRKEIGIPDDITKNGLISTLLGMTRMVTPDMAPDRRIGVTSARLDSDASIISMHLDEELKYGQTAAELIAKTTREMDKTVPPFEMALVLEDFAKPEQLGEKSFKGGYTMGRLYLYSEAAGAVICAAEVQGESSREVTVHSLGDSTEEGRRALSSARLTGELIVSTIDSGLGSLHAVDPSAK